MRTASAPLLDARDYALIEQVQLASHRRTAGLMTGEQRSMAQGGGIEFADYREYVPGDDVRRIDWPVYMRFRKLLVRLCAEEKEHTLAILVDNSRSMFYGSTHKALLAKRIAAILSGIALAAGNRVGILSLGKDLKELLPPQRSRVSLPGVIRVLNDIEPEADADPAFCIRQFAARYGRRTMAVLLSDLLFEGWERCVSGLGASGSESTVVQVLAPAELEPEAEGDVNFVDMETGAELPLHVDGSLVRHYKTELEDYLGRVKRLCHAQGLGHAMISSERSLFRAFHDELRKGGLVW